MDGLKLKNPLLKSLDDQNVYFKFVNIGILCINDILLNQMYFSTTFFSGVSF